MSIDRFFVRDIQIVEPSSSTDRYGSSALTYPAYGRDVKGWLSQTGTAEPQQNARDPLVTDLVLFLPAGTAITGYSRVIIDDATYTVEGHPHEAWSPSGEHHLEVRLQEVTG